MLYRSLKNHLFINYAYRTIESKGEKHLAKHNDDQKNRKRVTCSIKIITIIS